MQKLLLLSLFVTTALSGCRAGHVVVPDSEACTVAGILAAGAMCSHTLTSETRELTVDEFFNFLEPKEASEGEPARAGAVCESTSDYGAKKSALEQACRILGKNCTYELRETIEGMTRMLEIADKQVNVKAQLKAGGR